MPHDADCRRAPPPAADQRGPTLAWAAYLATSWTWCIGLFLPILLLRDYGWPGYLAFALPNVVGAAAMAWVLRRPGASEAMVARHRPAMAAFSAVTVAFQVYVAAVTVSSLGPRPGLALAGAAAFLVSTAAGILGRPPWSGVAGYLVSTALVAAYLASNPDAFEAARAAAITPQRPAAEAWALVPVCIIGFATCPYLDRTFHIARQALSAPRARAAFGLGFGALFLAMILFTAIYAAPFLRAEPRTGTTLIVLLHVLVQMGLTAGFHLRESRPPDIPTPRRRPVALGLLAAATALAAAVLLPHASGTAAIVPLDTPLENIYRGFMVFYGLVFPAHTLACIAGGAASRALTPATLAVALAAPFYWLGFIERRTWWLLPGAAGLLLIWAISARLQSPHRAVPAPNSGTAPPARP